MERIRRGLYVDDILSGSQDITEAKQRKSNVPELEDNNDEICDERTVVCKTTIASQAE